MGAAAKKEDEGLKFLAWATETFPRFCGLLDIRPKDARLGRQKFRLNAIQKKFCQERTGRDIVLKARQLGMTTLELARDVFTFLTVNGSRVLVVVQSKDDNGPLKDVSKTVATYFDSLRRLGAQLDFSKETEHEWHLGDSTLRVMVAGASETSAEKGGRAGTCTRLHITEIAFYDYAKATMNALMECVPSPEQGGEIVVESTPNGAGGLFYEQCNAAMRGQSSFKFHFIPWFYHQEYQTPLEPGETLTAVSEREKFLVEKCCISQQQLKWYRQKVVDKTQDLVDQEYPCDPATCFLVSGRKFFDREAVRNLIETCGRAPIEMREQDRIRIFTPPVPGEEYILVMDPAEGLNKEGEDASGAIMYNRRTAEHVASIDGQYPPEDFARAGAMLGRYYNTALIVVERQNHGHAVLLALSHPDIHDYPELYIHFDDMQLGFPTTDVTRPVFLNGFEAAVRKGEFKSPDLVLLGQMAVFVIGRNAKPEAAPGTHDDLVIPAAMGWFVRGIPRQDPRVGGRIKKRGSKRGGAWT